MEPTGRQAGQLLGQAAWTSLSLGHRWADTSMPGAGPKQGSPWLLTRSWEEVGHGFHAPQMRKGRWADTGIPGAPAALPAPPPHRPPDRLPGPIC